MHSSPPAIEIPRRRNTVAAILSGVVPGLGQFYKGHPWEGAGIILIDFAVVMWVAKLFSPSKAEDALFTTLDDSNGATGFLSNPITISLGVFPRWAIGRWLSSMLTTKPMVKRSLPP